MAHQWYIIHTYSGYEEKVKTSLEETIKQLHLEDKFLEVLVPTEKVVELVKGQRKTSSRKFYPGYVLVHMELNDQTWHIVKGTPKVTGFLGGNNNPTAIPDSEAENVIAQMVEGISKPKPKFHFDEGDEVKVIDGPFSNFIGRVEEVKEDKAKLRVLISIFGRATPVELEFVQVEKI
ncbi:MAG: transcription termination/antitermination protein NusG [Deltaproteobacteria bacterium]|nr:transcription termination/antitermination protein NusG [Deltaproteobacteria bacterium]MBW2052029.1 transcription termination/antitermination protein NusG [Deltaproteobacteria bacterium]MBW2140478.1 transcription termination/antitermination protein NusG [Deltaproteobacteria bacterium]MBW2323363.1 transcription termination/antitermination protein NusG [Deltaproteobacteria bacterium]